MTTTLFISLGNFLFKTYFPLYKILYRIFKNNQDAFEINLIRRNIRPGDVVLDIGANIGFYTTIFSELTGSNGQVHAFEPDPENCDHLRDATKKLENVNVINKAVDSKSGKLKLFTSKKLNVDHRTYKTDDFDRELEVEAISIDDFFRNNNPGKVVDFIKIDIQGFEMEAMKGMIHLLESNPQLNILSEFWPYGLKKAGSSALEYFIFLNKLGFEIKLINKNKLETLNSDKVIEMDSFGEKIYFNVFISRQKIG